MLPDNKIRKKLLRFLSTKANEIQKCVIREALDSDEIRSFFDDLLSHGCVSGMVNSLIYYCQTHAFFDRHYDEIEEIRQTVEIETGYPIIINGDLKNCFAWTAFEYEAFQIANRFNLVS